MIFEQRPYQTEFIEAVLNSPLRRILGVLPTGTGKTICFSEIARRLNRKTLILAHREELIEQACTKVAQVWEGVDIGVVKAERHEIEKQVMVASIQSLYRDRLETLPQWVCSSRTKRITQQHRPTAGCITALESLRIHQIRRIRLPLSVRTPSTSALPRHQSVLTTKGLAKSSLTSSTSAR